MNEAPPRVDDAGDRPEELSAASGRYHNREDDVVLVAEVRDGHLFVGREGGIVRRVFRTGPKTYFEPIAEYTYRFDASQLSLTFDGNQIDAPRIRDGR